MMADLESQSAMFYLTDGDMSLCVKDVKGFGGKEPKKGIMLQPMNAKDRLMLCSGRHGEIFVTVVRIEP